MKSNSEYSKIIKDAIKLSVSPTAVKIYQKETDAKKDFKKIDENIMHCQAIITAGKGKSFYATRNELGCPFGIATLGLTEIPEELKSGQQFDKMNVASSQEVGEKLYKQVPKIEEPVEAIAYMPLEDARIDADVVVIIAKPRQIFDLIRAHAYINGERVDCNVGGTQSLCGDIVADTYNTGLSRISFGCMGSHLATELRDDEVIMSIPFNKLEEFTNALSIVTRPPKRN